MTNMKNCKHFIETLSWLYCRKADSVHVIDAKLAVSICCRPGRKAYCLHVFSWVSRKLAVCCLAELEEKLIVSICVTDRAEKLTLWTRIEACCLPVLQSWKKAYYCRARMLCQLPRLLARPLYNQAVSGQMGLFHTSSSLSKWVLIRWLFSIIYTCCGSMTCWYGSGSGSADPDFWLTDPDPAIFVLFSSVTFKMATKNYSFQAFCL